VTDFVTAGMPKSVISTILESVQKPGSNFRQLISSRIYGLFYALLAKSKFGTRLVLGMSA
jgi:hypothetical protein